MDIFNSPSYIELELMALDPENEEQKIKAAQNILEACYVVYEAGKFLDEAVYSEILNYVKRARPQPPNILEAAFIMFETFIEYFTNVYYKEIMNEIINDLEENYFSNLDELDEESRKSILKYKSFIFNKIKNEQLSKAFIRKSVSTLWNIYTRIQEKDLDKNEKSVFAIALSGKKPKKKDLLTIFEAADELLAKQDKKSILLNIGPFEYWTGFFINEKGLDFIKEYSKDFIKEGTKRVNKIIEDLSKGITKEKREKMKQRANELLVGKKVAGKPWPWKIVGAISGLEDFMKDKLGVKFDAAKIDPLSHLLFKGAAGLIKQISLRKGTGESYRILEELEGKNKFGGGRYGDEFKVDINRDAQVMKEIRKQVLKEMGIDDKDYESLDYDRKQIIDMEVKRRFEQYKKSLQKASKREKELNFEEETKKIRRRSSTRNQFRMAHPEEEEEEDAEEENKKDKDSHEQSKSKQKSSTQSLAQYYGRASGQEHSRYRPTSQAKPQQEGGVIYTRKPPSNIRPQKPSESESSRSIRSSNDGREEKEEDESKNKVYKKTEELISANEKIFSSFFKRTDKLLESIEHLINAISQGLIKTSRTSIQSIENISKAAITSGIGRVSSSAEKVKTLTRKEKEKIRFERAPFKKEDVSLSVKKLETIAIQAQKIPLVGLRTGDLKRMRKAVDLQTLDSLSKKMGLRARRGKLTKKVIGRVARTKAARKAAARALRRAVGRRAIGAAVGRRLGASVAQKALGGALLRGIGGFAGRALLGGGMLGGAVALASTLYKIYQGFRALVPKVEKISSAVGPGKSSKVEPPSFLTPEQKKLFAEIMGTQDASSTIFDTRFAIGAGENYRANINATLGKALGAKVPGAVQPALPSKITSTSGREMVAANQQPSAPPQAQNTQSQAAPAQSAPVQLPGTTQVDKLSSKQTEGLQLEIYQRFGAEFANAIAAFTFGATGNLIKHSNQIGGILESTQITPP